MRAVFLSRAIVCALLCTASAWGFARQAPNGTNYNVDDQTGALGQPAAFSQWAGLCVRVCADCATPCAGADVFSAAGQGAAELNGLQWRTAADSLAGLDVVRTYFVPSAGGGLANGFIRYLDLLTNNTGAPITVQVRFGAQANGGVLGAGMQVWRTHSDDGTIETTDRWAVVDDDNANGGLGAVGVLVHGAGARQQPTRFGMGYPNVARPTSLAWDFDGVVVNPGQTVGLLTLVVHEVMRLNAINEISSLTRVREADALFGLTDDERRAVLNFDIEPGFGTPVADAGGPYNADEGEQVQLTASGYDPELGQISYVWDLDDDGVFDDFEGTNATVTFPDDGPRRVRVRITDQAGETDTDAALITVRNVTPVIEGVNTNQPLDEGQTLTVEVPVTDPGADQLFHDFDWDGDGEYDVMGLEGGPFEHRYFQDGFYNARVRVRDDEGADAVRNFPVSVANVAPQILQVIAPSPALEGADIGVQVIANDPGNDPITYRYDIDGDGDFDQSGVGLDQITISFPDDGIVTMRVQVTDDQGATSERDHELSILNARPNIIVVTNSGPVAEGSEVVIDVAATDPGTDELTYSFDFDNDGSFEDDIVDQGDNFAGTVFLQQGEHTVGVRVRDDDGGFAVDTTTVTVDNAPPTAELFAPQFANEGEVFEVRVEAADPGDDELVYDWDLTGDGQYDLVGVADAVQNTSFPDQGDYDVRCRVSDGDGGEVVVSATIRVSNVRPELEIEFETPQFEGAEVAVEAVVDDPGNDELRFFFDFDDDGDFEIENALGTIGRHRYPDEGVFTIRVLVDDGSNLIDTTGRITIENAAPAVDLQVTSPVPEGDLVRFTVDTDDPGVNDVVRVDLFFDTPCNDDAHPEGAADLADLEPDEGGDVRVEQVAADGLDRSRICACASDDDGGRRCVDAELVVTNVDPVIPDFAPLPALEGRAYNVGIPATDAANPDGGDPRDPLVYSLENPPAGIGIDENFGIIDWVPTYQHYLSSPIELTACVEDGDGGRTCAVFAIEVDCIDDDLDSMCDTWERNTCNDAGNVCLDPADPLDAEADPDQDGRNNGQEFGDGTNPFVYEGPLQPEAVAPEDGVCSDAPAPTFELTRVEDELERPVELQIEVFSDAALQNLAVDSGWLPQPAMGGAMWTPDEGLLFEDQTYWWRGRARTENPAIPPEPPTHVITPWTETRTLRRNADNAVPTAPTARAPEDGSQVGIARPTLEVLRSTDQDGECDSLLYRFRIYRANNPFTQGEGEVRGDSVVFVPTEDLIENGTFQWDVVAVDRTAEISEASERWTFTVDSQNQAPDTPTLVAPGDRSVVDTLTPEFVAEGSTDVDQDDTVAYHFKVRVKLGDTIGDVVAESEDVPEDADGQGVWVPEAPLEEDTRYVVEVYATDGLANSEVVDAEFFVSAVNAPPEKPEHTAPENGATVQKKDLLLSWTRVTDPEGTNVTYDVELCRDSSCTTTEELGSLGLNVSDSVFEGATYTWRVQAVDGDVITAGFTEAWTFTVEDPTGAGGGGDDCGCGFVNRGPGPSTWAFAALLLLGLRRRRR